MSPQHWEQEAIPHASHPDDTYYNGYHNHTVLHWGKQFKKTIPVDNQNVFTFTLASGYKSNSLLSAL
jgi:hypothetical protein